jgi:hypothetical protein
MMTSSPRVPLRVRSGAEEKSKDPSDAKILGASSQGWHRRLSGALIVRRTVEAIRAGVRIRRCFLGCEGEWVVEFEVEDRFWNSWLMIQV